MLWGKDIDQEENPRTWYKEKDCIEISIYNVLHFLRFHLSFVLITKIIVSVAIYTIDFCPSTQNRLTKCGTDLTPTLPCLHRCGTKSEASEQLRSELFKHLCRKRLHFLSEDLRSLDSLKDHKEMCHLATRPIVCWWIFSLNSFTGISYTWYTLDVCLVVGMIIFNCCRTRLRRFIQNPKLTKLWNWHHKRSGSSCYRLWNGWGSFVSRPLRKGMPSWWRWEASFHTYVLPQILVTEYRYEITGIKEENLQDAMPLEEAWEKIQQILHNGGSIITVRLDGGKAKVLVGDYFEKHLDFLEMNYHDHLLW